jgi:RNA polymerase sigma factor (sigma-70 family)
MAVVISDRLLESSDRLLDAEPDDHLVSLVQTGHEAAFAAIVRRYERELQAHARRLSSDGRAEDAVQQAFLNAFAALQGGSEVRHLRGWLHQILRHEITRARMPIDVPLEATVACGETLEDTVTRRATAHAALAELSALPDRQRDALLGTAVLGFPRAQVARTMGLSEGAVRQLVHRARLRMRQAATAIIAFPLVKLFGAARSGVDANPDAAVGAGTAASASAAASGGLAIKIGGLLASGVLATGIAVTHTSPSHHHGATAPAGHHLSHADATRHVSPASAASAGPAFASDRLLSGGRGTAAIGEDEHGHGGRGRPSAVRSGGHGGPRSGREGGHGHDGSPVGGSDGGSGHSPGGSPSHGNNPGGSGSGSPSNAGSGSNSGSGSGDDNAGAGHHGSSGSPSGSTTGSSGSGSGNDAASSDNGHGAGQSSGGGGSSSTDSDTDTTSSPGSSGSAPAASTTRAGSSSDDAGSSSDQGNVVSLGSDGSQTPSSGSGSGGGKENVRGARDVSGSLDSSSS